MQVSDKLLKLIATPAWEGDILRRYLDSAGLPSIGIGHKLTPFELNSGTLTIDGIIVRWEAGITQQQALDLLRQDMHSAETCVNHLVQVALNQDEFDSLCSLTFNIGTGAFASSTVLKRVNGRDFPNVPAAFLLWNKEHRDGQLVVCDGLIKRRKEEIQLWNGEI